MAKKMLVNVVHPEEARVAIVEDGHLVELDVEVEGHEQTRGNVYKGVVVRVEPGLQAAFVDIGLKKLGFLQLGEIHPEWYQWRDDVPQENRHRRPRIQEILRRGQELIVQVEKGERDMKGAALTTYLSLPGRYMVIMPGSDSAGVSRKVENEADRKQLKEMAATLNIPEGYGYILRTEALGKKKTDLSKDFKNLLSLCKEIKTKGAKVKGPALIYQESDIVTRFIRDYFTSEIDEVLVDSQAAYESARAFFKKTMPKLEHAVKLHHEKRPIFSRYQLEEQIDHIYEKKVPLKSGGSLVIDPTEALVSIDVNSGKSTGERNVEDTAFRSNMEAAEEAARQLRLRDLGGLIVIDFIDMRDKKHIAEVEKCLKHALKSDKARVNVGRISQFGLLEMSRQRIRQTLTEGSSLICPHCSGHGKVKSVETMALSFLRKVHAAASKGTAAEVRGGLPLEVAYYLLNRKKRELAQLETEYDIEVTVKGKPSFLLNQLEIEIIRREKPHHEVKPEAAGEAEGVAAEELEAGPKEIGAEAGEEGKKKRKRKRKKKQKEGEAPIEAIETETVGEEAEEIEEEAGEAGEEAAEAVAAEEGETPAEGGKKKRRRRRRRGKKPHGEEGTTETAAPAAEAHLEPALHHEEPHPGEEAGEARKKRKRKRRRGAKPVVEGALPETAEQISAAPTVVEAAPQPAAEEKAKPARKPRQPRKKKEVEAAAETPVQQPAEATAVDEKPSRTKRAATKKVTAKAKPAADKESKEPLEQPEPAAEKPKRARAPRKKKETAAE